MIGVFDSGHGGLTVLQALTRALPGEQFVYFGDHAHAPYGDRDAEEIYALTLQALEQLFGLGCPLVIMACNTAAATGLRRLQHDWLPACYPDRRVIGVIVPMVEAITGVPWMAEIRTGHHRGRRRTVAVFATRHTVQSQAFVREIGKRAAEVEVVQQACPVLVRLIEQSAPIETIRRAIRRYVAILMRRLGGKTPEAVVLGCTHYPLVADLFAAELPKSVEILSQPEITAKSLIAYLEQHPEFLSRDQGPPRFYTSSQPSHVSVLGSRFYGGPIAFLRPSCPDLLPQEEVGRRGSRA